MIRVQTLSGHVLAFDLVRRTIDDREVAPTARMDVTPRRDLIEMTPADVESLLSVLFRIREKQRDYVFNPCRSCRRDGCQWCFPKPTTTAAVAEQSNAPAASQAPASGKRRKTTAK